MTAGLPGTPYGGGTFHRRILVAMLIATIAIAPARAQHAALPDIASSAVADIEDATTIVDSCGVVDDAPETSADVPPVDTAPPTATAEAPPVDQAATPSDQAAMPSDQAATPSDQAATPSDQAATPSLDQVIYKGFVGNLLEAMPLDPDQRVQLQRGNAVINNTFTGRSLALLLGIASPPLMLAGLIWGIWSAVNIKPAQQDMRTAAAPLMEPEAQTEQPPSSAEAPQVSSPAALRVIGAQLAAQALD